MKEVYLSFAAFYFIIKKTGIGFNDYGKNYIALYYGNGIHHFCHIKHGMKGSDCGYIAINSFDYENLFGDYTHLVDPNVDNPTAEDFYDFRRCERPNERKDNGSLDHGTVDLDTRKKINFKRCNGDEVKCLNL